MPYADGEPEFQVSNSGTRKCVISHEVQMIGTIFGHTLFFGEFYATNWLSNWMVSILIGLVFFGRLFDATSLMPQHRPQFLHHFCFVELLSICSHFGEWQEVRSPKFGRTLRNFGELLDK